ncbi:hypothetical protein E1A91_D10G287200v1 [Gossypium mustelinum]|uniref:TIR domain-containing protein n=1 Tax=Gossypium mustelinum TaxID=34275 RepID=A0A5D2TDZ2_GOSMU|nr:hypothetical protein E1A91_D10G287200v1 [Gossypium mustelinum]
MASSSSSCSTKHQVFLSFRGETRFNFTAHLLKALKDKALNVFFDEDTLETGEQLLPALSQGIAASNLSIIVLSKDFASSKSCLAEVSDIMDRNRSEGHIVLPIFYHVDPSNVRNLGGSFKTSFEDHESRRPTDEVKRWTDAFAKVGKLKGIHIQDNKSETEYIQDIVDDVTRKLMNSAPRITSEKLVGIDDQKKMLLGLIEQADIRVIGFWGMGGIGKTTLANAVFEEVSPKFECRLFLKDVNEKEICIDTPSISYPYQDRLNNKKVLLVLDDVSDPDQIDFMGVKYFGPGSKIIVTSRDRQVKKLNKNDSLQLFSTFAFKLLNPVADFQDLSCKFVEYAQGSPLALKVLGSNLYTKSKKEWESEVDKLKQYVEPKISQILKSSLDGLGELEKNIFLDVACFFKGEKMDIVEKILSNYYMGAICGIRNLVDKCLLDSIDGYHISMHDMLEEIGKDIVRQKCKENPGKCSRLWFPKDVDQVLRYNQGTVSIEGIKLDMSQIDKLQLCPSVFENMFNLRYIYFYKPEIEKEDWNPKLLANQVDSVSLPNKLRYLCWDYFPFKSLSSFNSKNLIVLKLRDGKMEKLWNEDDHMDLVNLRKIDISYCENLRKIPSLLGAINLEFLGCYECESLVELPCLNHLASLHQYNLRLRGCYSLKKFPQVPSHFSRLNLSSTKIKEVPDSIELLHKLQRLSLRKSKVKKVSINISKLEFLHQLDLSDCPMIKFPEIPRSLTELNLSGTQIEEVSVLAFRLPMDMWMDGCKSLNLLSELPPYLQYWGVLDCTSLEKVSFAYQNLYQFGDDNDDDDDDDDVFRMLFCNYFNLNQESIDNIEATRYDWKYYAVKVPSLICCFPGKKISANKFKFQSMNSSLCLKIAPNGGSGNRFLVFAICLVVDLTHCVWLGTLAYICEYQLRASCGGNGGGVCEKFRSMIFFMDNPEPKKYMGNHVFILSSIDMVKEDKNYEDATFEFCIRYCEDLEGVDYIKVERCGVHVFYMDAKT